MVFRIFLLFSSLLWAALFFASAALANEKSELTCGELIQTLGYQDLFHEQPQFRAALREVLVERRAKKRAVIPVLTQYIGKTNEKGDLTFRNMFDLVKVQKTYDDDVADTMVDVSGTENVFSVTIANKTKYFRPRIGGENEGTKARKTLSASKLATSLKVKSVPSAAWVRIGEELGSLSDEVKGVALNRGFRPTVNERLAAVDPKKLSVAIAFEFLVGNMDGVHRNVLTDGEGNIFIFDHDTAFVEGLVMVRGEYAEPQSEVVVGPMLPEKYSKEFVELLAAHTPTKIRKQLEFFLSDEEIEGVIFRREIILKDIELRPGSVF